VPGVDLDLFDRGEGGPENAGSRSGFATAGAGLSRTRGSESIQDSLDDDDAVALELRLAELCCASLESCSRGEGGFSSLSGLWLSPCGCS